MSPLIIEVEGPSETSTHIVDNTEPYPKRRLSSEIKVRMLNELQKVPLAILYSA